MRHHFRHINRSTGKELFEAAAFIRGFGMERKGNPVNLDGIRSLNPFNTPGNEIAPGSDEIRKNIKPDEWGHGASIGIFRP
jgi:hypothetical protein